MLDLDPRNGSEAWEKEHGQRLPLTRAHQTRSGGMHVFFRHLPGMRCSTGKNAPGVDIKADGGYVIFWPAVGIPVIMDENLAPWPVWLLEQLAATFKKTRSAKSKAGAAQLAAPSVTDLIALVDATPNGPGVNDREPYYNMGFSIAGAMQGLIALGRCSQEEQDVIADAWARWAEQYSGDYEFELDKWERDFACADTSLGWQALLRIAAGLGADVSRYRRDDAKKEFKEYAKEAEAPGTGPQEQEKAKDEPKAKLPIWDPWQTPIPPAFPLEALSDDLREVVQDTHETLGVDLAAAAAAHLAAIAAAVHGQTRVRVQRYDTWSEESRLWMALVGEPSSKKTPLVNRVLKPFRKYEQQRMEEFRLLQ